jgi:hypothetical protein
MSKFKEGDYVFLTGFRSYYNDRLRDTPAREDTLSSSMKDKLLVIRYYNHTAPFEYAVTEPDSRIEERGLLVMEDQLKHAKFAKTKLFKALNGG